MSFRIIYLHLIRLTRGLATRKLVGSQLTICILVDSQLVGSQCDRLATRWLATHNSLALNSQLAGFQLATPNLQLVGSQLAILWLGL